MVDRALRRRRVRAVGRRRGAPVPGHRADGPRAVLEPLRPGRARDGARCGVGPAPRGRPGRARSRPPALCPRPPAGGRGARGGTNATGEWDAQLPTGPTTVTRVPMGVIGHTTAALA